jgi:HlyD family secretion protein
MKLDKTGQSVFLPTSQAPAARPPAPRKKKSNNGLAFGLIALVLAVGGGLWASQQYGRQQQARQEAAKAKTVAASRRDVQLKVTAGGTVYPLRSANISPKSFGRVAAVYVREGERVRKGQLLAQIDDSNLQGQLLQAQGQLAAARAAYDKARVGFRSEEINQAAASLSDAEAALSVAENNFSQDQALFQQGAISERVFENSRGQRERAQAQVESVRQALQLRQRGNRPEDIAYARAQVIVAQGAIQTIRAQIDDTRLRAPFDGVVTRVYSDPGTIVSPTTPRLSLDSTVASAVLNLAGELIVKTNVAEADIVRVRPGQPVLVRADAYPGRTFRGQVREVAPQSTVVQNVTSFEVKVSLTDPTAAGSLRAGMSVDAEFQVGQVPQALLIPTVAIVRKANDTGVYTKDPQGRPEFRTVRTGINTGTQTQILSGLKPDEQVFLSFPPGFRPDTTGGTFSGLSLRGTAR